MIDRIECFLQVDEYRTSQQALINAPDSPQSEMTLSGITLIWVRTLWIWRQASNWWCTARSKTLMGLVTDREPQEKRIESCARVVNRVWIFVRPFEFSSKNRGRSSSAPCILQPWSAPKREEDLAPFSQEIHKLSIKTLWNIESKANLSAESCSKAKNP